MEKHARAAAVINLDHVAGNIGAIRKMISPKTMIMAVVKANGYGHGSLEISAAALEAGADWLGVATVSEGVTLRGAGITAPILVLSPAFEEEFEPIIQHDLASTFFSLSGCQRLSQMAGLLGKTAKVHIKIDTGFNRIGYRLDDMDAVAGEILTISKLPGIEIQGVYSHLATSDSDPEFVGEQLSRFLEMIDKLAAAGLTIPIKHISNSGGVLGHPECNLDLVRCGILIYGMAPDSKPEGANRVEGLGFRKTLTVKSRVAHLKTVKKGESVGYSRNYFARKDISVATIPIGYADGFSRHLSNVGKVLICGRYCDIIGTICMDQFMADVTGVPVEVGDEVVIIGKSGENQILAEDVAGWRGTINYEVAACLAQRIPKYYVRGEDA
ncbi:MAG: alanine racemase [Oscillospiraceae bacterium]|nr:alanine racemase [Oscillospiraceae bacterium]